MANNFKERLQELQQRMKAIDYPNDFDWKKEFEFEVDEFSHHEELFELFEENFPFTFDEEKGFTVGNASWEDMQKLEKAELISSDALNYDLSNLNE